MFTSNYFQTFSTPHFLSDKSQEDGLGRLLQIVSNFLSPPSLRRKLGGGAEEMFAPNYFLLSQPPLSRGQKLGGGDGGILVPDNSNILNLPSSRRRMLGGLGMFTPNRFKHSQLPLSRRQKSGGRLGMFTPNYFKPSQLPPFSRAKARRGRRECSFQIISNFLSRPLSRRQKSGGGNWNMFQTFSATFLAGES